MTETFESYRPLLFSIAYRMLGSAMEAEDVVQEAYLRYQATPPETIRTLKPFLTTIVTRLCLDQLKSARIQRETYIGSWLPEPVRTGDDTDWVQPASVENSAAAYETVSMAFLILLENLSPVERAVFLLREVFEYSYDEIAAMLDKDEAACRQSFHRAKQHINEHRSRYKATAEARERMTQKFLYACNEGTVEAFMQLLAEDVVVYGDGGGKAHASRRPIVGRDRVARFLSGLVRISPPNLVVEVASLNGVPTIVLSVEGHVLTVMTLETDGDLIYQMFNVVNPDKLAHL